MRWFSNSLVLIISCLCLAQRPDGRIFIVGEYSNMRFTGEHQYGYSVELYRQGDTIFGLLLVAEGLDGDTPAGILEDVEYEPASEKLSFNVKLSVGAAVHDEKSVPSRDYFEFDGKLERTVLSGTLKRFDKLNPELAPQSIQVRLAKGKGESMENYASYASWKKAAGEILKTRGPKW